jgi:hypothetical protein
MPPRVASTCWAAVFAETRVDALNRPGAIVDEHRISDSKWGICNNGYKVRNASVPVDWDREF